MVTYAGAFFVATELFVDVLGMGGAYAHLREAGESLCYLVQLGANLKTPNTHTQLSQK